MTEDRATRIAARLCSFGLAQNTRPRPQTQGNSVAYLGWRQTPVTIAVRPKRIAISTKLKKVAVKAAMINTMIVVKTTSRRVGQTTLATSARTCCRNWIGFIVAMVVLPKGSVEVPDGTVTRLDGGIQARIKVQGLSRSNGYKHANSASKGLTQPNLRRRTTNRVPDRHSSRHV